jgi:hypothetical protein
MALAGGSGVELGELEQWAVVTPCSVVSSFKILNHGPDRGAMAADVRL